MMEIFETFAANINSAEEIFDRTEWFHGVKFGKIKLDRERMAEQNTKANVYSAEVVSKAEV